MTYDDVVDALAQFVPDYHPTYPDLPHTVVGGLISWLGEKRHADLKDFHQSAHHVGAFVNSAVSSNDQRLRELVKVSVFENLHLLADDCTAIVQELAGPSRELLAEYEHDWGPICQ